MGLRLHMFYVLFSFAGVQKGKLTEDAYVNYMQATRKANNAVEPCKRFVLRSNEQLAATKDELDSQIEAYQNKGDFLLVIFIKRSVEKQWIIYLDK